MEWKIRSGTSKRPECSFKKCEVKGSRRMRKYSTLAADE
jgi:hypothetical protein